ncbi:hypothetical protein M0813_26579 [Anaeramoeba flamelloides]|uniref:Uncharacterized protein n=1 Tax=Anaeramoeba flamelloides TaxID=1746091 RepID=A0ABQ8XYX6_9EUKA|nr:hypothetical protein M0813_26579 [Anaeramoeba flamelloides]
MTKIMSNNTTPNEREVEISSNQLSKSNGYICSPKTKTEDYDDSTDINNLSIDEISSLESSDDNGGFINIRKGGRKKEFTYKGGKEKQGVGCREKMIKKKRKKTKKNNRGLKHYDHHKQKYRKTQKKKLQKSNQNKIDFQSKTKIDPFTEIDSYESYSEKNYSYDLDDIDMETEEVQETGSFMESLQTTTDSEEDNIEIIDEYISEKKIMEQIEKIAKQNINSSQQLLLIIHQWYQQKQQNQRANKHIYSYKQRKQQNQQKKTPTRPQYSK